MGTKIWNSRRRGNNLYRFVKRNDVGSIGIGAMIVFIAMVLVAGIAASVLIQTSTRLEMAALRTGQETIAEVASGLNVDAVEGCNVSGSITKVAIEVAPRAGSPDIDLSQTIIELSDSSTKYVLSYGGDVTNTTTIEGDIFNVNLQDVLPPFDIRHVDHDSPVESSGAKESGIQNVGSVGCGDEDDAFVGVKAIHLH